VTLRIWERRLRPTEGTFEIPTRFRVVPGTWPEIEFADADGTTADVRAPAYELQLRCDPGAAGSLTVFVAGFGFSLLGRTLVAGDQRVAVPGSRTVDIALLIQGDEATLTVGTLDPIALSAAYRLHEVAASAVTENIAGFRIGPAGPAVGSGVIGGDMQLLEAVLYGLRESESSVYRTAAAIGEGPGEPFYESGTFTVYDRCVTGAVDDDPPALVTDRATIVSPIRVTEEFVWRDNDLGDMTRVVDRQEVWRSLVEPGRFPDLTTSFRTVDAAWALAMETFQRNASDEFALPGDAGKWSAGYFQGPGLGFGVWKRDTSHIALRSGSLLDPVVARASLAHVTNSGFDNGSDGDALPTVAIWDHYLATGDGSLVIETWPRLVEAAAALDERFDEGRGLVAAAQSTSNDCFDEPEVDGFALSVQVYAMQTYDALSRMAGLPGVGDDRAARWAERASTMRRSILSEYWSDEHGFFTSGPRGSESHEKGYWETSGSEAALWGHLGEDAEPRAASALQRLRTVAMSDYGVILFPYREPVNHFCGSVWYCWQAGIARAAARMGDAGLIHQLVGQQVRTVVRNKTFYEVTEASSGESWRWPGQLWHAAGFASLILYGVLGIRYDLEGMSFCPAVARQFDGTRLTGLHYRDAVLDIEVRGEGTQCELTVDGRAADRISADVTGRHAVVLTMR
jgi:hypothetical protein